MYVNLLFAVVAVAGAAVWMRTSAPASRPKLDWIGTLLASSGLFFLVFGFSRAAIAGWTATVTVGSLTAGAALLTAFVLAERRVAHPLLPLRVVTDRTRGGAYVSVMVTGIAIFGVFLFLTYYLQLIKGYSPVTSGLAFLPMIACILLASNLSQHRHAAPVRPAGADHHRHAARRRGHDLPDPDQRDHQLRDRRAARADRGSVLGFGSIFAPAINTATMGVDRADSGVASALVNTGQQVGGSIGTALLSTIALTATSGYLALHHTGALAPAAAAVHGYTVAFAVSASLFGLGAILALTLLPSRRRLAELRAASQEVVAAIPAAPAQQPVPAELA